MTRILLDIETVPEWLNPPTSDVPTPLPWEFTTSAEARRREKAPVRWAKIDDMRAKAPDQSLWAPEYQKELLEVDALAEKLAMEGALDPLEGRIVAIGVQVAGDRGSRFLFSAPEAAYESFILTECARWLAEHDAWTLVTYCGSGFDIPYLRFRMLKHQIPWSGGVARHVDLSFELPCVRGYTRWKEGQAGPLQVPRLSAVCTALGLPPTDDLPGSEVPRLVRKGRLDEVNRHLGCDLDRLDFLDMRLGRP